MNYPEIKKHIIGKKYFWNYSTKVFMFLILCCLIYINKNNISLSQDFFSQDFITTLLIFWILILSIYCMLINLYRCRSFYKFYNFSFKQYNAQFYRIIIEKENYKMTVPTRSFSTTIRPSPKQTNAVYVETDDFLLLFFSIQYFGLVRQVLKPFIFVKNNKEFDVKSTNVNVIRDFETIETEENRTLIFPNNYGITKVIITV